MSATFKKQIINMNKGKFNIILNSVFCFVSAFIMIKGIIALLRFIMMRHFSAWVHLINFDLICMNGKDARIWTPLSVISMYSVGFLAAAGLAVLGLVFFFKIRKKRGLLKLFAFWFYVIALNQSLGVFLRDIPIKRDLYHALNWMYVPYEFMIGLTIFAGIILFSLNGFNYKKALRVVHSTEIIRDNKNRRKTYAYIVMFPAIISVAFLLLLHFYNINAYEIIEFSVLLISLAVPYIVFLSGNIPKKIKILRDEPINQFNKNAMVMAFLFLIVFFVVKMIYF